MLTRSHGGERFPLVAAIVVYALAFGVLAWPWLSGAVTIPWDGKSQFYPELSFLARSLAQGQSPFWTPNVYAGWPQIADPQSLIFSPLFFLLALLDPSPSFQAADAVTFALLFIGGVGMILIFRDRNWHVGGALVAAIVFAFGCSAASRIQHVGQIESLAYFPLALWALMRALDRSSWRWGAAAGLAGGLIAIGRDQVSLLALYVLCGYVLWHWLDGEGRWPRIRATIVPLVACAVVGLLVTALPVLFTVLLAADSNRPIIGYTFAGRGSLHPVHLLMLVFADLFGASDPMVDYWGPASYPWLNAWGTGELFLAQNMGQVYAGAIVPVVLVGLGLIRGMVWTREIRFFTVATVFILLYALGRYTPAFHLMYNFLPGVMQFRRPADATFIFGALLALIAGYLIHRWLTGTVRAPTVAQRAAEVSTALGLTVIAIVLAYPVGTLRQAAMPIAIGVVCIAGAIATLYVSRRLVTRWPVAAVLILVVFSVGDLAWNNRPNESTGFPPSVYDADRTDTKNETIALLKQRITAAAAPDRRPRVEIVGIAYHWPNLGMVHGFDHLFGQNPLRLENFERATNAPDVVAGVDQQPFAPLMPSYRSKLYDLFGVRFIALGVPIEEIDKAVKPGDFNLIARTKEAYIYENPRAFPRVMVASAWRVADFEAMYRDGWPDLDLRKTVLLEHAPAGVTASEAGGTARIVSYRNTVIEIEADAPSGGLLVLNDTWHPWWRASVDGKPAEILKANVIFRAVALTPGRHVVRFEFHAFEGACKELREKVSAALR